MSASLRFALVGLVACGGTSPSAERIEVDPPNGALLVGEQLQLTATVYDGDDQPVGGDVTWRSTNPAVAEVDAGGKVSGRAVGGAEIRATADGQQATAHIDVAEGGRVGTEGGTVSARNGAVTVVVPPGQGGAVYLSTPTLPGQLLDLRAVAGSQIEIRGVVPVTLRLAIDREAAPLGLPEGWLRLARVDVDATVYREVTGSVEDPGGAFVEGPVTTAGIYAVRVAESPGTCDAPEHRQFDFWLGSWDVVAGGPSVRSDITRDAGGCLILEHWQAPVQGKSINFWNPALGKWFQTWNTTMGGRWLRMSGGLVDSKMVLRTDPSLPMGQRYSYERLGTRVRQTAEGTNDGGVTWNLGFDGIYTRR